MTRFHPESPDVSREHLAKLRFVADFRKQLHAMAGGNRAAYEADVAGQVLHGDRDARRAAIRDAMEQQPFFQGWSSLLRSSQDLMWGVIGQAVDADRERMALRLRSISNVAQGSLDLDPKLEAPSYLTEGDTHRMPGGYMSTRGDDDLRAGALYDLGGAIYQLGIGNAVGGLLNDSRGRTLVAHLHARFPALDPSRILDLGCGVGHNTVPLAAAFPQAETFGVDIGAALLRYAHLRAEGLGRPIRFVQDNAEHTRFPDGHFDLVVTQIVLHETSPKAMAQIIRESRRLLAPGGVAVHLEVPLRAEPGDDFQQVMSLWEQYYNIEPNIAAVIDTDLAALARDAGLQDVQMGYQTIPAAGVRESRFALERTPGPFAQWLVVSGQAA
jgi:SAM-dependent methyltransferase